MAVYVHLLVLYFTLVVQEVLGNAAHSLLVFLESYDELGYGLAVGAQL